MMRIYLSAFAVLFVCLSWLPAPVSAADGFQKSKVQKLLYGNENDRGRGLEQLKAHDDDEVKAELLIKALDKDARKSTGPPRDSVFHLMNLLGTLESEKATKAMLEYVKASNYKFAIVAAHELSVKANGKMLDTFFALAETKNFKNVFGFRKTVVDTVLKIDDPRTVEYAVKLLPLVDGIVRYDLLKFLTQATDQDFGNKQKHWTTWWNDNKEDFRYAKAPLAISTSSSQIEIEGIKPIKYYGMSIYARRIVFVVDISSSMFEDGPPPPNDRLAAAKKELAKTLRSLPDDTSFAVIAFNAKIKPWAAGKLVQANEKSREGAARWVEYLKFGKGTNSNDALAAAFKADGNTETIMFLSDGKPSRGVKDPDAILRNVRRENMFRKMSVFTVGVFTGGETNPVLVNFMRKLAKQNAGVYRHIR
jgi:hypothetical protein